MKLRLAGAAALLVMLRAALVCAQEQADAGVETPDAAPAPAPVAPAPAPVAPAPAVAAPGPTAVAPAPPANVPFMPPPPPPGTEVGARAPDGTAPVKPYTHHGFHFGLQLGASYFHASSTWVDSSGSEQSRAFVGPSLPLAIVIAGTIHNTVVFGGMLGFEPVLSLSATDENGNRLYTEGTSFKSTKLGPLLDVYLRKEGGVHFLAAAGLIHLAVSRPNGDYDDDPTGEFLLVGGGYEWWLPASSVSLGVLAKFEYAALSVNEGTRADVSVISPGLALTFSVN